MQALLSPKDFSDSPLRGKTPNLCDHLLLAFPLSIQMRVLKPVSLFLSGLCLKTGAMPYLMHQHGVPVGSIYDALGIQTFQLVAVDVDGSLLLISCLDLCQFPAYSQHLAHGRYSHVDLMTDRLTDCRNRHQVYPDLTANWTRH